MRWFKKIVRAVLALLPAFLLSIMISYPSYATSHELKGFRFAYPVTDDGDLENQGLPFYGHDLGSHFNIQFPFENEPPENARIRQGLFVFNTYYTDGSCKLDSYPSEFNVQGNSWRNIASGNFTGTTSLNIGFGYVPSSVSDLNNSARCNRLNKPFDSTTPLDLLSLPNNPLIDNPIFNHLSYRTWYTDHMAPYWYSTDGFYSEEHHINTSTGEAYTSALSLSDFLGIVPNRFNALRLPLYNSVTDEDCTGSLLDRDVDVNGVFRFTDPSASFVWNQDLGEDSKFSVLVSFFSGSQSQSEYFDCTSNLVTIDGYRQLEFTCPVYIDSSLYFNGDIDVVDFSLYISGYDDYGHPIWVWDSSNWTFAGMYVVTDNSDTPGCTLHADLSGNDILGDHTQEDLSSGGGGWFSDLTNLFTFSFINPFNPIFGLFSDSSSCASIPTISSMIHSEETQVCPWFNSTIRQIVTPVIGLSSMMLLFGFAVRWLKSSSGNDLIDTGGKK